MNYKNLFVLLIFLFYLGHSFSQEIKEKRIPINIVQTAEIGTPLISAGKVINTEAVKIIKPFEFRSGFFKFNFSKETIYPFVKIKKGYKIFYSKSNFKDGRYWGIAINEKNKNEVYSALISSVGWVTIRKKKNYRENVKEIILTEMCKNCYRQELIFNGSKGTDSILSFTYREFIGNIARPAFFQNVEYNIKKDNIIGFKGLRLKIIEFTNTEIKYEILKSFSPI